MQGRRANQRPAVVPSSRRGKYFQLDAQREGRASRKGKWSPRGTGATVLTYRMRDRLVKTVGMGGNSPRKRPSAPGCGDTLKALASYGSI